MEKKLSVYFHASRTVIMGYVEAKKLTYCSSLCKLQRCPLMEQTCKKCEYNQLREDNCCYHDHLC